MKYVCAKTNILAIHSWPDAKDRRAYLRNPHAHVFGIKVFAPVKHGDREIEFHDLRLELHSAISHMADFSVEPADLGHRSCEQIGEEILIKMPHVSMVKVSEDEFFESVVQREVAEDLPPLRIVTLCGSTKFRWEYEHTADLFEKDGWAVFSVGSFPNAEGEEVSWQVKQKLDDLHKAKILHSDAIFVINPRGYLGSSTKGEIEFAKRHGKTILSWEPLE